MVAITKDEAQMIRERFPYAHIVRTMKQKSKRHKYFCEESRKVIAFLADVRSKQNGLEGTP